MSVKVYNCCGVIQISRHYGVAMVCAILALDFLLLSI